VIKTPSAARPPGDIPDLDLELRPFPAVSVVGVSVVFVVVVVGFLVGVVVSGFPVVGCVGD